MKNKCQDYIKNFEKARDKKQLIKRTFKYIGIFALIVLGIFMGLIVLIILSALSTENEGNGSGNIIVEYNGTCEIPNFERPPTIYADTMEEALAASADAFLGENSI